MTSSPKKLGAADVAHMRQSITDLLNNQADEKVRTELREQVNDFLIANYSFDLPQSLIDTEKKHRFSSTHAGSQIQGELEQNVSGREENTRR